MFENKCTNLNKSIGIKIIFENFKC